MKRYLKFNGDTYYAEGGWEDYRQDYDTLEEAMASVETDHGAIDPREYRAYRSPSDRYNFDWVHIVDTDIMKIVKYGNGNTVETLVWMDPDTWADRS